MGQSILSLAAFKKSVISFDDETEIECKLFYLSIFSNELKDNELSWFCGAIEYISTISSCRPGEQRNGELYVGIHHWIYLFIHLIQWYSPIQQLSPFSHPCWFYNKGVFEVQTKILMQISSSFIYSLRWLEHNRKSRQIEGLSGMWVPWHESEWMHLWVSDHRL